MSARRELRGKEEREAGERRKGGGTAARLGREAGVLGVARGGLAGHVELRQQLAEAHHAGVIPRVRGGLRAAGPQPAVSPSARQAGFQGAMQNMLNFSVGVAMACSFFSSIEGLDSIPDNARRRPVSTLPVSVSNFGEHFLRFGRLQVPRGGTVESRSQLLPNSLHSWPSLLLQHKI